MDKYFLYDPIEHEFMTFKTQSEQGRTAEELIDSYKGDEWPDGMEDILCGIITEKAKQINVKNRPAKLDEGYGED